MSHDEGLLQQNKSVKRSLETTEGTCVRDGSNGEVNYNDNADVGFVKKKKKSKKVDLFQQFKDQVGSKNPPKLVSFKRKVSSSKYKGVLYVKSQNKWRAQVCLAGKKKYIGSFDSEIEAALARDKKIVVLFGDRPELMNFPRPPAINLDISMNKLFNNVNNSHELSFEENVNFNHSHSNVNIAPAAAQNQFNTFFEVNDNNNNNSYSNYFGNEKWQHPHSTQQNGFFLETNAGNYFGGYGGFEYYE